jgi:hypothetical protein
MDASLGDFCMCLITSPMNMCLIISPMLVLALITSATMSVVSVLLYDL